MSKYPIKRIRTLALVGQAGSGKTSLAEALLARAGAVPPGGSVERGNSVCDYTALEKTFKHSLKLAVASFEAQEHRIHLLDTPGYPDFIGHALPALAAVETAVIISIPFCALTTMAAVSTAASAGNAWPMKSG